MLNHHGREHLPKRKIKSAKGKGNRETQTPRRRKNANVLHRRGKRNTGDPLINVQAYKENSTPRDGRTETREAPDP